MRFQAPLWFLALLPVVAAVGLAYWRMARGRYSPAMRVPWSRIWGARKGVTAISPRFWHVLGFAAAAALMIVALARPQLSFQKVKRTTEGIDIVLVLDMSASMRVEDFRDQNRMAVAKGVLQEFVKGRQSDRIGLVTFSGEPVTMAPPTLDYDLVLQQLEAAEIGDLKDGTAIGEGLALAVTRLNASKAKTKVIILVTDGDNNMGQIDPLTAGEMAKGYGIKVYSIAIGQEGRVRMPFVQKDIFGRSYRTYQYYDSSINPDLLKKISAATGGKFYRVEGDEKAFRDVFKDIDRLEKTVYDTQEQVKYDERFVGWLQAGLLVLLTVWAASQTVLRVYP